jgi:hypothetical protein
MDCVSLVQTAELGRNVFFCEGKALQTTQRASHIYNATLAV